MEEMFSGDLTVIHFYCIDSKFLSNFDVVYCTLYLNNFGMMHGSGSVNLAISRNISKSHTIYISS